MNAYYKVYQTDGRIENFHWNFEKSDVLLDLILDLQKGKTKIKQIHKKQWYDEMTDVKGPINVHQDLNEPNDAEGEYVGFIEHYEI